VHVSSTDRHPAPPCSHKIRCALHLITILPKLPYCPESVLRRPLNLKANDGPSTIDPSRHDPRRIDHSYEPIQEEWFHEQWLGLVKRLSMSRIIARCTKATTDAAQRSKSRTRWQPEPAQGFETLDRPQSDSRSGGRRAILTIAAPAPPEQGARREQLSSKWILVR
jgi:hypothetical protein